jgi:hypothetical protein
MDKLETYLDQVCRSMGGPRSLRRHVRQELREHLLDAVAQHKAAGLSEEAALEQALEEFGHSDEVRSELIAAHGERLLAVIIDKAMQWKEMTMKAKWLWSSWAHLALVIVVVLGVLWIAFATVFLVPKFQRLMMDGLIDAAILQEHGMTWTATFLSFLSQLGKYTTWLILLSALLWGLFEWRVRSENKTLIRLSILGSTAVGVIVLGVVTAASLVIPYMLAAPEIGKMAKPFAVERVDRIDMALAALEQAVTKKDWQAMSGEVSRARESLGQLETMAPAVPALTRWNEPPTTQELHENLKSAEGHLREAEQSLATKDASQLEAALKQFRSAFEPVREVAKRSVR